MASVGDGRPEVLGFKIDECPTCHRIGTHVLTETPTKGSWGSRSATYVLVCTTCGAGVSVPVVLGRSAGPSGKLAIDRPRPGFDAAMAARPAPSGTSAPTTSPYATGSPDAFIAHRLGQARAALAAGASPASVQRELFDQFVPNPKAHPAPTGRNPVPLLGAVAAIILAVVVGFISFLWIVDDPMLTGMLSGADEVTSRPTATTAQAPEPTVALTPEPTLAPGPTPTVAPNPVPTPSQAPVARLTALVPQDIRPSCEAIDGNLPGEARGGVRCLGFDDLDTQASYFLYDDAIALSDAFEAARQPAGVTEFGGACWDGGQGQYSDYLIGGSSAGYVACYTRRDKAIVLWTRRDSGIMARVARTTDDVSELMDWWMAGTPGPL